MHDSTLALDEERLKQLVSEAVQEQLRASGFITREELDQRMTELESRANESARRIASTAVSEAETRLNGTVTQLVGKFEAMTDKFDNMVEQLSQWRRNSDERIGNWTGQIERVAEKQADYDKTLSDMRLDSSLVEGRLKHLSITIHGDPEVKDSVPSLFQMVNTINSNVQTITSRLDQQIADTVAIVTESKQWIDRYEARTQQRRAQLERWKKRLFGLIDWLLKNKAVATLIVILIILLIAYLLPQTASFLLPLMPPIPGK